MHRFVIPLLILFSGCIGEDEITRLVNNNSALIIEPQVSAVSLGQTTALTLSRVEGSDTLVLSEALWYSSDIIG